MEQQAKYTMDVSSKKKKAFEILLANRSEGDFGSLVPSPSPLHKPIRLLLYSYGQFAI